MTLNLTMPTHEELKPRITVFGVGGAGGNAVNNMIDKQLEGVEFVVANTDAQALQQSVASTKVQMGLRVTEGLGAGARPSVGAAAAEETIEEIVDHLAGAHMCFITAGMGGGTGTGAAPIIAQAARELGVLTVGVVTKPFQFEGAKRMRQAEEGIEALQKMVDTLIIIPNQNLFRLANEKTTFTEAFSMADDVLYQGVKGVTDLMVRPGLINLDFADVRAVMDEMGKAMMGTGEAEGEDRAVQAAEKAIANPLLDEISLKGAKGVLINITGSHDLTLFELDEAANRIREEVDADANIIVGSTLDTAMEGRMRVSVVATGIDANANTMDAPIQRRKLSEPLSQQPAAQVEEPVEHVAQVAAEQARPQAEPSLFEDIPAPAAAQDDLPPPAYQPQPQPAAEAEPAPTFSHQPVAPAAPQRHAPGTPSPEALARLERVTGRPAGSMAGHIPGEARRPSTSAPAPVAPAEERPRFGINNLINRMSGAQGGERQPQMTRQQPNVARPEPQQEVSQEQERIEIPAFLRRQAN
ncbi:cell division protein FtsZ [Boseongicola aestuarii]|uniref:Cell division protein FtsZ n=1 Tax=Boseongicola aestuarii TaxID=1470561 RepID=A0A238IWN2_9RHOB|nr:cell division protein FtsZ [Boseongicola aestuarii]SMX22084.1 Cell division protein FtsZ [Boseongicola aestuarii]